MDKVLQILYISMQHLIVHIFDRQHGLSNVIKFVYLRKTLCCHPGVGYVPAQLKHGYSLILAVMNCLSKFMQTGKQKLYSSHQENNSSPCKLVALLLKSICLGKLCKNSQRTWVVDLLYSYCFIMLENEIYSHNIRWHKLRALVTISVYYN